MPKRLLVLAAWCWSSLCACSVFDSPYFVEWDVDGVTYRATGQQADMIWYPSLENEYEVIGVDTVNDAQINLTLFEELGTGRIPVGERVGIYLTDISFFIDGKTYTAVQHGGDGWVDVSVLTDTDTEGTFEATLKELDDPDDVREVTNGAFKVSVQD